MFEKYPDILTINDMQKVLGIGRSMAYKLINDKKIKHLRIGKTIKIPKQFLVDFIEETCYTNAVVTNSPS